MAEHCDCDCARAPREVPRVTRRGVLAGTAAVTATLALGACADPQATGSGASGSPSASATGSASATASATATASASGATSSAPAASATPTEDAPSATASATAQGGSATPTGERLAGTEDFPAGGGAIVPTGNGPVVVTHPDDTTFVAFNARCPHQGCTVSEVLENTILCACHGSVFDAATGDRLEGPAPRGLTPVPVEVDGGSVYLA